MQQPFLFHHVTHDLIHAHGARMLRMAPLVLVPVDESEEDDRNP